MLPDRSPIRCTPSILKPNARIGVVWPAGPAPEGREQRGLATLRALGFEPICFRPDPGGPSYLAGPDSSRARALEAAFADDSIDAVWAMRGGYGCIRTLEALDRDALVAKPLIGFSDVTALLLNLDVPAFHGPVVTQTADIDDAARAQLLAALTGELTAIPFDPDRRILAAGRAEGRLLAANLSVLTSLVGTPWQPNLEDSILALEDVAEAPYRVDRMLTQLRLSGALAGVVGLVFGRFSGTKRPQEEFDNVFADLLAALDVPAVRGLAIGHTPDNRMLPLGVSVVLEPDGLCL